MTITSMIGQTVTDSRGRTGTLTGPIRWVRGQLCAYVNMHGTGHIYRVPAGALRLTPHARSITRLEAS